MGVAHLRGRVCTTAWPNDGAHLRAAPSVGYWRVAEPLAARSARRSSLRGTSLYGARAGELHRSAAEGAGVVRWPWWRVWVLCLTACPLGLLVVWLVFPHVEPTLPPLGAPPSPPQRWAGGLFQAHVALSLVVAVAVPARMRPWSLWVPAWAGIAAGLVVTGAAALCVIMDTTGFYF